MDNVKESMIISILIVCAIALVFIVISIIIKSLQKSKKIFGKKIFGTKETECVKVVSKKIHFPKGLKEQHKLAVFEKQSGQRIELAIKDDRQFRIICESDSGTLTHVGNRFISFVK